MLVYIIICVCVTLLIATFIEALRHSKQTAKELISIDNKLGECTNSIEVFSPNSIPEYMEFYNNPINIKRLKGNKWDGSIEPKYLYSEYSLLESQSKYTKKFEAFYTPYDGINASIKIILTNIRKTNNVKEFVYRIATDNKEGTKSRAIQNYVSYLEQELGYSGKIKDKDVIKVLRVMILLEGGGEAVRYFMPYMECKYII